VISSIDEEPPGRALSTGWAVGALGFMVLRVSRCLNDSGRENAATGKAHQIRSRALKVKEK
jgi:hypothetical protein